MAAMGVQVACPDQEVCAVGSVRCHAPFQIPLSAGFEVLLVVRGGPTPRVAQRNPGKTASQVVQHLRDAPGNGGEVRFAIGVQFLRVARQNGVQRIENTALLAT